MQIHMHSSTLLRIIFLLYVDLNGKVDVRDATEIQRYIAEITTLTDTQLSVADMNYNGIINVMDATAIQRYLVIY